MVARPQAARGAPSRREGGLARAGVLCRSRVPTGARQSVSAVSLENAADTRDASPVQVSGALPESTPDAARPAFLSRPVSNEGKQSSGHSPGPWGARDNLSEWLRKRRGGGEPWGALPHPPPFLGVRPLVTGSGAHPGGWASGGCISTLLSFRGTAEPGPRRLPHLSPL